jgi:hypothetical protein
MFMDGLRMKPLCAVQQLQQDVLDDTTEQASA